MSSSALVDSHCHFDLFPNPQQVLKEAERNRIYSIAVTNTPSVFEPMQQLTKGLTYVRPAIGLHPELAIERASELPIFERHVSETRYVGEVGLDYKVVNRPSDRSKQRAVFATVLKACAQVGGRILTIHSRRAEADVIAAVREYRPGLCIFHWYSGSLKDLEAAVSDGAYFSVNAAMVRSERGRRIIQEIPRDRVITESDGPFLAVGGKPASPLNVHDALNGLTNVWTVSAREAREGVFRNFERILQSV